MNEILVLILNFITQNEKSKNALGTLLYADIGQPQFRQKISQLPVPILDNNAVEYDCEVNGIVTVARLVK